MRYVIRDKKTLKELNKEISIIYEDGYAVVSCSGKPNRKTKHSLDKGFSIYHNGINIRISTDAMLIWKDLDFKYSLIDIQNVINIFDAKGELISDKSEFIKLL